jgi:hypothetical protein
MAVAPAVADDQTLPGARNADADALAKKSPMVRSAYSFLQSQASRIKNDKLRKKTLDALGNPDTCIQHRKNLTDAQKVTIAQTLIAQGLVNPADAASIVGSVKAGVFPPVLNDGTNCPKLPQPIFSAPGSTSVFGHHSYPGAWSFMNPITTLRTCIWQMNTARSTGMPSETDFRPLTWMTCEVFRLRKGMMISTFSSTRT